MALYIVVSCSCNENDHCLRKAYVQMLAACGAMPVIVPAYAAADYEERDLNSLCRFASGLLLTGGGDAEPRLYGEADLPSDEYDTARDSLELRLIECFRRLDKPILGICRGMQMINIACGGSLYRDLPVCDTESDWQAEHCLRTDIRHSQQRAWQEATHEVRLCGKLKELFNAASLAVNSFHHQGIRRLGKGLCGGAYAADGLCEGFYSTGLATEGLYAKPGVIFGVQWHPEHMADAAAYRLFEAFVLACKHE